jgi:hypothetical protein
MAKLSNLFRGGHDELGWDDLIRRIVDAVAALGRFGERGTVAFTQVVAVTISVAPGSGEVVRGFVQKPELDREVGNALANRCDCDPSDLPFREYSVEVGEKTVVSALEGKARPWQLVVEGGDRSGQTLELGGARPELRFGRGEWHGPDGHIRNDLILCDKTAFVSRRAGKLVRTGHQLEVTSLDQGDALLVRLAGGEVVRPSRTARGRLTVGAGDVIELVDGAGNSVRLTVRRETDQG